MTPAGALVSGLIVAGYLVIGLFFLRFYRQQHDRLFVFFAFAFWLLALQRALLTIFAADARVSVFLYGLRAFAFLMILYAFIDKNRKNL